MGNSKSKTIKKYDNDPGLLKKPLHSGAICCIACDGETVFSGGDDNKIAVIKASDVPLKYSSTVRELVGHSKAVNRMVYRCGFLWSISRDLTIRQWSTKSFSEVQVIAEAHTLNLSGLAIPVEPNSSNIVCTGSRDYSVKVWDIENGRERLVFKCPRNIVTTLAFSPTNSDVVYQGSEDLCIRGWDIRQGGQQPVVHMTGYVYFPLCLDVHREGYYLATGSKGFNSVGCEIKLWDLRKPNQFVAEYHGHTQDVTACQFSRQCPDMLLSASKDGTLLANDVAVNNGDSSSAARRATTASAKYFTGLTCYTAASPENSVETFALSCNDGSVVFAEYKGAISGKGSLAVTCSTQEFFEKET